MLSMIDPNIEDYCIRHSTPDSDLLKALVAETHKKMEAPHMLSGPIVGHLLKLLVS
jgi:predicted O-methyltransferase YrrM